MSDEQLTLPDDNPTQPSLADLIAQARGLLGEGDIQRAKSIVVSALRQAPKNTQVLMLYANIMRRESPDKSIKALKEIISQEPTNQRAHDLLNELDPDGDDLFGISPKNQANPSVNQPNINVVVNSTATSSSGGETLLIQGKRVNKIAFIIAVVCGIFGFMGVAHFMTGKILGGIGALIMGWCWIIFMVILSATFICLIPAVIFHFLIAIGSAIQGASVETVTTRKIA